jgi:hypothetical protein
MKETIRFKLNDKPVSITVDNERMLSAPANFLSKMLRGKKSSPSKDWLKTETSILCRNHS